MFKEKEGRKIFLEILIGELKITESEAKIIASTMTIFNKISPEHGLNYMAVTCAEFNANFEKIQQIVVEKLGPLILGKPKQNDSGFKF